MNKTKRHAALGAALVLLVLSSTPPAATDAERPDPVPVINGMVFIPAGEFAMGSTLEDVRSRAALDEFPQRMVFVDDYYIDVHEVTNVQYKFFVDSMKVEPPFHWGEDGNYPVGRDGYPVVGVTWEDAAAYARFVGKRLPTEPEWEKAARGLDRRRYPWGDQFDSDKANNSDELRPIMSFPEGKSPYGVFDMAGNAAEWVDAWYAPYPRTAEDTLPDDMPDRDQDYGDKEYRVYRGGSWNSFGQYLRCANRERERPDRHWLYIGFRCAMDPPWKD